MARFARNVLRPRSPLLRPQVVVVVVLLAGMAVRTGANVACVEYGGSGDYGLAETDGKCPAPEINAAFAGKLTGCYSNGFVSRVCACARCVRCAAVPAPRPDQSRQFVAGLTLFFYYGNSFAQVPVQTAAKARRVKQTAIQRATTSTTILGTMELTLHVMLM